MNSPAVGVGLIGFGVVGSGTARILLENKETIERRAGCSVVLRRIAELDLERTRRAGISDSLVTRNALEVLDDPSTQIIVEVIGGAEPALEYVLRAIESGKCVVTSNKELIAKHGAEILDAAKAKGVDVNFEGSVGGGIPIIAPLKQGLVGNQFRQITGIVNGTTNYILTRMTRDHRDFAEVLVEAQRLGYAEADPSSDVDGLDATYKITILAAIAFGHRIRVEDVYREGIRSVSSRDILYADELGYVVKLLAVAKATEGGLEIRVHPAFVPKVHPLAAVNDVFNAIMVEGDFVGRVMFYGRGAGAEPTGSAVVGDIVDAARNIARGATGRVPCTCSAESLIKPISENVAKFCLRMTVLDKPGVLGRIATVFGAHQVSLASVVQKGQVDTTAEIFWMTHEVKQKALDAALAEIRALDVVDQVCNVIRVEGE